MRDFDPHLILLQCCPQPLGEKFKKNWEGKTYYRMVMPQSVCPCVRGFYFQPIIAEISFNDYIPTHSKKTTFILIRWNKNDFKKVSHKDGSLHDYPVLAYYIFINRDIFEPLAIHHNKIEWLDTIAALRTQQIAHELLYAEQYFKYFDTTTGQTSQAIELPLVEKEEELLCPIYQIRASIENFKDNGNIFKSEEEFLKQQTTTEAQRYYNYWLETYAVRRETCHRRTCEYLASRDRHHKVLHTVFENCKAKHKMSEIDPLKFKLLVHDKDPFAEEFFIEVSKNGCPYTKIEVIHHITWLLGKHK